MEGEMTLRLTSPAFAPGARIPVRYTCDGEDLSPPLAWSGVPAETQSLALFCDDPDAPAGIWHHWALFDLPAAMTELRAGYPREAKVDGTRQAINDFGGIGYRGPCHPATARITITFACWRSTWGSCRSGTSPNARKSKPQPSPIGLPAPS
jgi:Raf kinase inhibitor-like YbhB/YbcL family protein